MHAPSRAANTSVTVGFRCLRLLTVGSSAGRGGRRVGLHIHLEQGASFGFDLFAALANKGAASGQQVVRASSPVSTVPGPPGRPGLLDLTWGNRPRSPSGGLPSSPDGPVRVAVEEVRTTGRRLGT